MNEVIHAITRWSARPEDETPLCGADMRQLRTVYYELVTCEACRSALLRRAADDNLLRKALQ